MYILNKFNIKNEKKIVKN